ncbi:hypothetical protein GQ457_03G025260 [Hibiscus cannabinus]
MKVCIFSKQVFSVLHLDCYVVSVENQWLQWLSHLFVHFTESHRLLFVVTIWALWFYRNKKLHENFIQSPEDIASFVQSYLLDIKASNASQGLQSVHPIEHWQPPPVGSVKTNFDVGFNSSNKSSVSGIIIRDSEGLVLASSTYPNNFISDPAVAEARACEQAVALTTKLGFRRAIVEGDAISVISKMTSTKSDKSHISPIVHNEVTGAGDVAAFFGFFEVPNMFEVTGFRNLFVVKVLMTLNRPRGMTENSLLKSISVNKEKANNVAKIKVVVRKRPLNKKYDSLGFPGSSILYPGDVIPFTRRPLFMIIDSDSSHAFKCVWKPSCHHKEVSMDSCVADSASVAMPRKLDSLRLLYVFLCSTVEGFIRF